MGHVIGLQRSKKLLYTGEEQTFLFPLRVEQSTEFKLWQRKSRSVIKNVFLANSKYSQALE